MPVRVRAVSTREVGEWESREEREQKEGEGEGGRSWPLERLVVERASSVNTAAAGGNASLMTIA